MSQPHHKEDTYGRLRAAAAVACTKRGANAGTVVDVIDTLYEHDLLGSSVSKSALRQSSKRARLDWQVHYCDSISLPCIDGTSFAWRTLSPHAALQFFVDHVGNFEKLLTMREAGEPLRLLFYHDEIVPGNPLHPDNARRTVAFYISFLQWRTMLHSELVWLPVALLRTQVIKTVAGGLSHCIAKLFDSWRESFSGRQVRASNSLMHFFPVSLVGCIMDESAMHAMWSVKGAAGRRPCMKCKNCVAKIVGATLYLDTDNYFRDICCSDINEFEILTDQDAWEAVDYLMIQQPHVSKKAFGDLEKNSGFTHNPNGVLAQVDLRKYIQPSTATFDLLHCFWNAGGIAPIEVALFVESCLADGMTWDELQAAVTINVASTHPSHVGSRKRLLTEAYFGGSTGWKASGSEHMMMMPLLHLWLMLHVHGSDRWDRLQDQCMSFCLLCERLYCLCGLVWTKTSVFCDLLKAKQAKHFDQFLKAYGREHARPKHHYSLHAADQWSKFECCLDTKTQERKHQLLKREIESSGQNLTGFEERMLRQLLQNMVTELGSHADHIGTIALLDAKQLSDTRWRSSSLKQNLMTWKAGQVVIQTGLAWAGILQYFERWENDIFVTLQRFTSDRVISLGLCEWQREATGPVAVPWMPADVYMPAHWLLQDSTLLTIW